VALVIFSLCHVTRAQGESLLGYSQRTDELRAGFALFR
jgi:hypothetical protein